MRSRRLNRRSGKNDRADATLRRAALAAIPAFPVALLWRPLLAGVSFFWGAPLLQFVPWLQRAAQMWLSGNVPLWNPLLGCGAPLAANYQTAAFYPPNVLHLLLPADVALTWVTALHLVLAGWGMYRLCRSLRLQWFAALIGALALEGSGFLVARVGLFPSVVFTFAWIPVWLWRANVLVDRGSLRDALWLGLSLGLGLLSGHAQTAAYGGLLVAAYFACRVVQKRHRRQAVRLAGLAALAVVLGIGFAAVQLLPTAELLAESQRSTGVDYDFAVTYSMWPWRLITFAAPEFFGTPGQGDYWGYATFWEDAGYVGLLPLLLAIEAMLAAGNEQSGERRSLVWFLGACAVVALLLALGKNTPLFPILFHYVPGFDVFQAPARWLAVTTVALAALAALGADRWPRGKQARRRGSLGVTFGLALIVGGLAVPHLTSAVPETFGPATIRVGVALVTIGVLALLRRSSGWWRTAVIGVVVVDLLVFGAGLVPVVDRALYEGTTQSAEVLSGEAGEVRIYWPSDPSHANREYDAEYRLRFGYFSFEDFGPGDAAYWWQLREAQLPNLGVLDQVSSANNYDPLFVGAYVDVLEAAVESPSVLRVMGVTHVATDSSWQAGETLLDGESFTLYRIPKSLGRAWIVPCGRQVDLEESLTLLRDPSFDPAVEVLLEVAGTCSVPLADSSVGKVLSLRDDPNRVTIRVALDGAGYLVLADTWYPGWSVSVNDQPGEVLRANYAFRAVWLEEGQHTVEMVYRPGSFVAGARVSLIALTLFVLGFICAGRRERLSRVRAGEKTESAGEE